MKDLDFIKKWQFAHRGLHDIEQGIPENSFKSFQNAVNNDYGIELDITILNDGTFICFHDDNLFRLTNINKNVTDYSYDDLKSIKLLNTNENIPLFIDVLNLVNGKVPLLIEIKWRKNINKYLPALMHLLTKYAGKFALFSFNPSIVSWLKKNHPNFIRGQITSYFHENTKMPKFIKYLMKTLFFSRFNKPDFISYNLEYLPNKYANNFYKKNKVVIAYTAKNQEEYDNVLKYYDNVVFENFIPLKNS